jgi:glutamate formiminotransferase/formiminotetrahydrofolate cyclodeaminase
MVSGLTLSREAYKDAWAVMEETRTRAAGLGARLRELVDEDARAFNSVVSARKLPRGTEEQKASRERAIQEGTLMSARVPLETLECLASLADLAVLCAKMGNPGCLTDAGSAAQMIRAGAVAAAWNVRVNLPSIRDVKVKEELGSNAARFLDGITRTVEQVDAMVEKGLNEKGLNEKGLNEKGLNEKGLNEWSRA